MRIIDLMIEEWEFAVGGIVLLVFYLPCYDHSPLAGSLWWIMLLAYIEVVYLTRKDEQRMWSRKFNIPITPGPSNGWITRWGVSWKTLLIIVIVLFFGMLIVFA